jgi:aerobic-type carbon monoxide dehydrogenase small subunit (CoxS/CutS family)
MASFSFTVNGALRTVEAEPDTPLLWVVREELGLTGTKYGCGAALCGACTLHLDGQAARSCSVPVAEVAGRTVTTIEGLGGKHPVQRAWIEHQVPQCGYCQTGMVMTAVALLAASPRPTEAEIEAAMTNICRCGTYARVRGALLALAGAPAPG